MPGSTWANLAHTLQVGRKTQGARLAFVFDDRDGLLRAWTRGRRQPVPGVTLSEGDAGAIAPFRTGRRRPRADRPVARLGGRRQTRKVAELWAKGLPVDWRAVPTPPAACTCPAIRSPVTAIG